MIKCINARCTIKQRRWCVFYPVVTLWVLGLFGLPAGIGYGIWHFSLNERSCDVTSFHIKSDNYKPDLDCDTEKDCSVGRSTPPPLCSTINPDNLTESVSCCGKTREDEAGACCNRHTRKYQPDCTYRLLRNVKFNFTVVPTSSSLSRRNEKTLSYHCNAESDKKREREHCFHILKKLEANATETSCSSYKGDDDTWFVFEKNSTNSIAGILGASCAIGYLFYVFVLFFSILRLYDNLGIRNK